MSYVEPNPPPIGSVESKFERDGDGWLYRRSMRAPAVRVTDAERRALIEAAAHWGDRSLLIGLVGGMVVVMAPLLLGNDPSLRHPIWIGGAAVLAGILVFEFWRLRGSPARALARRPPAAPARSRTETDRLLLAQTSWVTIAAQGALMSMFTLEAASEVPRRPFSVALAALFALGVLFWASRAVRKAWLGFRTS